LRSSFHPISATKKAIKEAIKEATKKAIKEATKKPDAIDENSYDDRAV
jgi:hypothetical protein